MAWTSKVWKEQLAEGEGESGIIVSYLSQTLQPLCVRKQGEAGMSLPSQWQITNITFVLAVYNQGRVHGIDSLLVIHYDNSVDFTQHCENKWRQHHWLNHETSCSASSVNHTRNTNTQGTSFTSFEIYWMSLKTYCNTVKYNVGKTGYSTMVLNKFW